MSEDNNNKLPIGWDWGVELRAAAARPTETVVLDVVEVNKTEEPLYLPLPLVPPDSTRTVTVKLRRQQATDERVEYDLYDTCDAIAMSMNAFFAGIRYGHMHPEEDREAEISAAEAFVADIDGKCLFHNPALETEDD